MAIDADLNAGLIGEEEARRRRAEISQEADFFGSMDGASKFVRGDAVAGILIRFINVIGGLLIGRHRYLIVIYGLLLFAGVFWIVRSKRSLAQWSSILTTITIVALVFPIYQLIAYQVKTRPHAVVASAASSRITIPSHEKLPDVYYIILDTYGRTDHLRKYAGYDDILRWADASSLDPNLVPVVMQIESCGNPFARSSAGAMGLFQVMPFHFHTGENPYNTDTNALRGLNYLSRSLDTSNGNVRLALAGYNGGIGVISRGEWTWSAQTLRYVYYGAPIYEDARSGAASSAQLDEWYRKYGAGLCRQASQKLGLDP